MRASRRLFRTSVVSSKIICYYWIFLLSCVLISWSVIIYMTVIVLNIEYSYSWVWFVMIVSGISINILDDYRLVYIYIYKLFNDYNEISPHVLFDLLQTLTYIITILLLYIICPRLHQNSTWPDSQVQVHVPKRSLQHSFWPIICLYCSFTAITISSDW